MFCLHFVLAGAQVEEMIEVKNEIEEEKDWTKSNKEEKKSEDKMNKGELKVDKNKGG